MENRRKREGSYQVLDELGTLLITNFPSRSVVVPIDVPLTKTDAPMTGWLSSSEKTMPVTFLEVWAIVRLMLANKQVNNSVSFLFI